MKIIIKSRNIEMKGWNWNKSKMERIWNLENKLKIKLKKVFF